MDEAPYSDEQINAIFEARPKESSVLADSDWTQAIQSIASRFLSRDYENQFNDSFGDTEHRGVLLRHEKSIIEFLQVISERRRMQDRYTRVIPFNAIDEPEGEEYDILTQSCNGMLAGVRSDLERQDRLRDRRRTSKSAAGKTAVGAHNPDIDMLVEAALVIYHKAGGHIPKTGGGKDKMGPAQRFIFRVLDPLADHDKRLAALVRGKGCPARIAERIQKCMMGNTFRGRLKSIVG